MDKPPSCLQIFINTRTQLIQHLMAVLLSYPLYTTHFILCNNKTQDISINLEGYLSFFLFTTTLFGQMSEFTYSNEGVVHNLRIIGFCGVYNGSSGNPHLTISFTLIRTSRIFRKSCAGIHNALLFNLLSTALVHS